MNTVGLIELLVKNRSLDEKQYEHLISGRTAESAQLLALYADKVRRQIYGTAIYVRGLIEISNICRNDCLYCGIRKSNEKCDRYRLNEEQIFECIHRGYRFGLRSFVLQGGEDGFFTDERLCTLIRQIKTAYPDSALALSLGERSFDSYRKLYDAGADRYLLRHETVDKEHYEKLHPAGLSYKNRIQCLNNLRKIGFQTGCGFMVGSPYQTDTVLAKEMKFIEKFKPDMCGIGPFIPHKDTPFKNKTAGSADLTCFLLSIIRLIHPPVLLPATTALDSIDREGRRKGILSGANVVMPNLSPISVRKKYMLYDNKAYSGLEGAEGQKGLCKQVASIGYHILNVRGDVCKNFQENKKTVND